MPFAVRGVHGDGMTVVELSGEVDLDTAPRMRAALEAAIRTGVPVVVDMGDVTFMDSVGFGVLVATHLQAKRVGTPLLVRAVSDRIHNLMVMLGLDSVLRIEPGSPDGRPAPQTPRGSVPSWGSERDEPPGGYGRAGPP
jgi:anti-sigma B factor antagonist